MFNIKTIAVWVGAIVMMGASYWLYCYYLEYSRPAPAKYSFSNSWERPVKRILFDSGVNDVDDCLVWAFGEEYWILELSELDDKWRDRHDIFVIEGHDCIVESTQRIAKAWITKD